MSTTPAPKRKPRLALPFVKRRRDPVTWIYDHRAGVFAILSMIMFMAILFIGSKIIVRTPRQTDGMIVDLRTVEELQAEVRERQREQRMLQSEIDAAQIRNAYSNEGAQLRSEAADLSRMNRAADEVNQRMRGNRDAWDEGMRQIEAIDGDRGGKDEKNVNNDTKSAGTVQISFSLVNPTRYSVDLYNPGYRCERGGEVTVQITVNRSGDVVAAAVDKGSSTSDDCMHQTALDAARRSRFDVNTSAPERQTGTITYIFIPQ